MATLAAGAAEVVAELAEVQPGSPEAGELGARLEFIRTVRGRLVATS